jgi:hypothetical protein
MYRGRMRTYEHTAAIVLDIYDIFYGRYKSDAGVGLGRRRRLLDSYGFRFPQRFETCS